MSEAERWTKVGERIDAARESAQRECLDVGGFFDEPKPSPWRWITHATFGFLFVGASAWNAMATNDDAFAHMVVCVGSLAWGINAFVDAVKAWRAGR